jgi:peptidyl-prolyl cis-trans isomerase-like 1
MLLSRLFPLRMSLPCSSCSPSSSRSPASAWLLYLCLCGLGGINASSCVRRDESERLAKVMQAVSNSTSKSKSNSTSASRNDTPALAAGANANANGGGTHEHSTRAAQTSPRLQDPQESQESQAPQNSKGASTLATPRTTHRVTIATSKGTITLDLYGADAPRTVENFTTLARRKFYDKTLIHRVARDFMVQGGDPKTRDRRKRDEWGSGGESIFGEPFADELNPDAPSFQRGYRRGALCMANRGPSTNTSQFFICLRDLPELPFQYTIFGMVASGMDVVDAIGAEPIVPVLNETDGRPVEAVLVRSVRIVLAPRSARPAPTTDR